MYGITMLQCPQTSQYETLKSLQSKHRSSSLLSALIDTQCQTYIPSLHSPHTFPIGAKLLDVQGHAHLMESGGICAIHTVAKSRLITAHFLSASSSFEWCSQDDVVIEVRG